MCAHTTVWRINVIRRPARVTPRWRGPRPQLARPRPSRLRVCVSRDCASKVLAIAVGSPWSGCRTGRSPGKGVHVLDAGVDAPDSGKLAAQDPTSMTELGHLLETFVVGELRKQAAWLDDVDIRRPPARPTHRPTLDRLTNRDSTLVGRAYQP